MKQKKKNRQTIYFLLRHLIDFNYYSYASPHIRYNLIYDYLFVVVFFYLLLICVNCFTYYFLKCNSTIRNVRKEETHTFLVQYPHEKKNLSKKTIEIYEHEMYSRSPDRKRAWHLSNRCHCTGSYDNNNEKGSNSYIHSHAKSIFKNNSKIESAIIPSIYIFFIFVHILNYLPAQCM